MGEASYMIQGQSSRKLIAVPSPAKSRETLGAIKYESTSGGCVRLEYIKFTPNYSLALVTPRCHTRDYVNKETRRMRQLYLFFNKEDYSPLPLLLYSGPMNIYNRGKRNFCRV